MAAHPNLIDLKQIIVDNFDQENFWEVGLLSGFEQYIRTHPGSFEAWIGRTMTTPEMSLKYQPHANTQPSIH